MSKEERVRKTLERVDASRKRAKELRDLAICSDTLCARMGGCSSITLPPNVSDALKAMLLSEFARIKADIARELKSVGLDDDDDDEDDLIF